MVSSSSGKRMSFQILRLNFLSVPFTCFPITCFPFVFLTSLMPGRATFRGPVQPSVRSAWWREPIPVPTTVSTLRMACFGLWGRSLLFCIWICVHRHSKMGGPKNFSMDFVLTVNFAHEDKFISSVKEVIFFSK